MQNSSSGPASYKIPDWPKDVRDNYFRGGFWNDETFDQRIIAISQTYADDIALCFNNETLTYKQLYLRAVQLANKLHTFNLKKGDAVILQLPNSINYVETLFALFISGIVPVFALPSHRENEILSFARAAQAKAWIYQDTFEGETTIGLTQAVNQHFPALLQLKVSAGSTLHTSFEAHLAPAKPGVVNHPDDLVCFQLSGGTTGTPKLIPRRHRDYLCNIRSAISACDFSRKTVYLAVLPLGHNFPLACPGFIGTLFVGGRVVISDQTFPDHCFSLIKQQGVTVTSLVPPLAMVWLDAAEMCPPDIDSLKTLQVGGAKMSYEAAKRVTPVLGCALQQVFGMAEGLICFTKPGDMSLRTLTTQGQPMTPADEIRVVDEEGKDVAAGEVGYLLTRGPYTIRGYYGPDSLNFGNFNNDGFYRSGDLVRLTLDGDMISEGRDKDQINRGGEKIDCGELEDILLRHPNIKDAAIVGIQDDYLGEIICAFLLCDAHPPTAVALRQFLAGEGVARFKIPDRFNFPPAFDLTGVGKVSKKQLRSKLKQEYLLSIEGK